MSSVVLLRPPQFHMLYSCLFRLMERKVYWANPPAGHQWQRFCMNELTGCPDSTLFAISEISTLASHRSDESQRGRVHDADLTSRSDVIRRTLRLWTPHVDASSGSPEERVKLTVAKIWNETAGMYLDAVLNDFNSGEPFPDGSMALLPPYFNCLGSALVGQRARTIIDECQTIPRTDARWTPVTAFPYTITACMSELYVCEMMMNRLQLCHDESYNGRGSQACAFVEYVWTKREEESDPTIDWRQCMWERWSAIPLF